MFRICKASNSYLCETRCVHCTVPRAMEVFLNVLLLLKKDPAFQLNHGIHWSRNNMLSQGREERGRAKGVEAEENFKGIKTTHTEQRMSNAVVQQRAAQFWEAISITLLEVTRTPWSIIHIIYNNSYSCINEKKKSRANIKSSQLWSALDFHQNIWLSLIMCFWLATHPSNKEKQETERHRTNCLAGSNDSVHGCISIPDTVHHQNLTVPYTVAHEL